MQKKRSNPKKKWLWLIPIVLLAAAGGGYAYYSTQVAQAQTTATEEDALQTTTARRGDLEITATGTGTLVPAAQISLGFDESGTLIELAAAVGDQVQAGARLARLQTKNTPAEIAATVADAQLSVIQAQSKLDALYTSAASSKAAALNDIATYAQEVRDAQYQLDNYTLPTYLQGMDAIEALDKMKAALEAAQAAFEPYRYAASSNSIRQELLEALSVAQANYDAAVKRLNYEYALQVAQANLDKARQEYDKYKDGPAADELAEAQA
ncbi:MAG: hypothetical protein JXB15_13640, partial [Anaerolineales bacterium]|nr:hypothetical protein [Anaerolineales bacterium]